MDLDKITIAMRPRTQREAMDLGLRLLQENWRALYKPWLMFILPLFVLLNIVFSSNMWIASLVLWWLKPLYDRILLFVLSRSLFADTPTTSQTLAAIPGLMKKGLIWQLSLFRLSPTRSFTLPVWILEGLSGTARRQRIQVLQSRTSGYATWLLILCWHLEIIMLLGFYVLILMFLPQNLDLESMTPFFAEEPPYWIEFVANSFYLMAILMIEPFYVAAGFMLYINRRNQLEAWDIEIQFRRMTQRLGQLAGKTVSLAASLLLVILFTLPPATPAHAEKTTDDPVSAPLPATESKRVIEEVLQHEDFGTERKVSYWTLRDLDNEEMQSDFSLDFGLGPIIASILKIILVGLLIAFIIYLFVKARDLSLPEKNKKPARDETPDVLFGMNITPESLPDDIITTAKQLWSEKRYRQALSLLYRGSLSYLVNEDNIALNNAMTEQDILSCAHSAKLAEPRLRYLDHLTRVWQSLAYAHRLPAVGEMETLFEQWSGFYAQKQSRQDDVP